MASRRASGGLGRRVLKRIAPDDRRRGGGRGRRRRPGWWITSPMPPSWAQSRLSRTRSRSIEASVSAGRCSKCRRIPSGSRKRRLGGRSKGFAVATCCPIAEHVVHAQLAPHGVTGSMVSRQEGYSACRQVERIAASRSGSDQDGFVSGRVTLNCLLLLECGRGQPAAGG